MCCWWCVWWRNALKEARANGVLQEGRELGADVNLKEERSPRAAGELAGRLRAIGPAIDCMVVVSDLLRAGGVRVHWNDS